MSKTIILGVGNPILGDDGVGIYVVRKLRSRLRGNYFCEEVNASGLELAEKIRGYDKAVLIDAMKTENGRVGDIYRLRPEDLPKLYGSSPHDLDFLTALEFLKQNTEMPKEIKVYGIEAREIDTFREELSKEVLEAAEKLINELAEELS